MNIKKTILDQYQIDIDKVNIIKIYKLESADISPDELKKKMAAMRKKWEQGATSTNDTIAERDKKRLALADKFEQILTNKKYLKELFDYYNGGGKEDNSEATEFAKAFFTTLKGANKTISQKDFDFFMQYFREEQKKNEKAILEMLKKEFHAVHLKRSGSDEEEKKEEDSGKASVIAQTRFHRDSVCLLRKCEKKYLQMQQSPFLLKKYPDLSSSMYEFLRLDSKSAMDFNMFVDGAVQAVFTARQNDSANSDEYIPFTEFYNIWKDLMKRKDVSENFSAFKKLIRYPALTPYMFLAEDVDIAFLETLVKMVQSEYGFTLDDFLFVYFKPLAEGRHYSFTLDKKLEAKLKKISKNPEAAEQEAQRRSAKAGRRKMIPLPLHILRFLATWPVGLVQLLFESFRFMVVNIQKLIWVVFLFLTLIFSHMLGGSLFAILAEIIKGFPGHVSDIIYAAANTYDFNVLSFILGSVFLVVKFAFRNFLVPALITQFLYIYVRGLDRLVDLAGFHRTFQNIQQSIDQQILQHYKKVGKGIYVKMIYPILANILTPVAVATVIGLIIALIRFLGSEVILAACI